MRWCLLLLLAGCASAPSFHPGDWTHPTKDRSDWKLDMADCERFFGGSDTEKTRCMTSKGWRPTKK